MSYNKRIDCTYLPDCKEICDDLNIEELNEAYKFSVQHKYRSFCTYAGFIPYIETNKVHPLSVVIDFPLGIESVGMKAFQIGQTFELGKHHTCKMECDVVFTPFDYEDGIYDEIDMLQELQQFVDIKLILEVENRSKEEIKQILETIRVSELNSNHKIKYLKTSTGRALNKMCFEEKLSITEYMQDHTDKPIKFSGGITSIDQVIKLDMSLGISTIFGISYKTLKTWEN